MPIIPRWQLPPLLWAVVTVVALCLSAASQAQDPHELIKPSLLLVTIETPRTDGTAGPPVPHRANGVLVSNDGLVLTSYSVFRNVEKTAEAKIWIQFDGGDDTFEERIEAEVAAIKDDFGLLVLQMLDVPEALQRAKTDPSFEIEQGTPIHASGYDTGTEGSSKIWLWDGVFETGHVSSKFLPTTADFSDSQVGSPVYNDAGYLVGIMTGDSETFGDSRFHGKQAITPIKYAESLIPHVRLWDIAASLEGLRERLPDDFDAADLNEKVHEFEELFVALRTYDKWGTRTDSRNNIFFLTFERVLAGEPYLSSVDVRVEYHAQRTPVRPLIEPKQLSPSTKEYRRSEVPLHEFLARLTSFETSVGEVITSASLAIRGTLSNEESIDPVTLCYDIGYESEGYNCADRLDDPAGTRCYTVEEKNCPRPE